MREVLNLQVDGVIPDREPVLRAVGLATDERPPERMANLVDRAYAVFRKLSEPRGLMQTISMDDFASVYPGEGLNEPKTPLAEIYPKAAHLALFAVTLGSVVSHRIEELFGANDFALGYILDAVASEGAEKAADKLEEHFDAHLAESGKRDSTAAHAQLRYSPGYCGWHISGQKKLFAYLGPEEIGIVLNDSFLMQPLKSVSGVLVSGEKEIHLFDNNYRFCAECTTNSCRERLKLVLNQ
jgi:hypothetical protein